MQQGEGNVARPKVHKNGPFNILITEFDVINFNFAYLF